MLRFPYMGTKHALAPIVADLARSRPTGPFLDAFAGMCSVANHVKPDRSVWTNDLQCFAANAAKAMLCDHLEDEGDLAKFEDHFRTHFDRLSNRVRPSLRQERLLLSARSFADFTTRLRLLEGYLDRRSTRQFDLFVATYANTYIGVEQAIEIDALMYSLAKAKNDHVISEAARRRFIFALGRTLLRASTTTGHFAQFQTPSERNWKRFQRTRRLSILDLFRSDYRDAAAVKVRRSEGNQAFNLDAVALLRALRRTQLRPSIVYADPPYKQDQYSRYYHLLETLVLYDYPKVTGKARYREKRATSIFSSKLRSHSGIEGLAALTHAIGADFILSYPEDGIADIGRDDMVKLLAVHFPKVDIVHEGLLSHSTMGASKGAATQPVIERIYLGRY